MNEEAIDLLQAGRAESSRPRAVRHFEAAVRRAKELEAAEPEFGKILQAEALKELAFLEFEAHPRADRWRDALCALQGDSPRLAVEFANTAVDAHQDSLSATDRSERLKRLRDARDRIDAALTMAKDAAEQANLLARKSSLLRYLAPANSSQRRSSLQKANRCARAAVKYSPLAPALLELALSEWLLAGCETTDDGYSAHLATAEEIFLDDALADFEPAKFALARFYRDTFRPLNACESFPTTASNRRRLLREAACYGEAASQLWYCDYPLERTEPHLTASRSLLESCLAAGYSSARNVVALAFVVAIADGPAAGETALHDLIVDGSGISWQEGARLATTDSHHDMPLRAFALGLDESGSLGKLATFASAFLDDQNLAEQLYRASLLNNPRNAIALTNLARLLIRRGDERSLGEAGRLLQKAQNFADRRFYWWRYVLRELRSAEPLSVQRRMPKTALRPPLSFDQVVARYEQLRALSNHQERGLGLEELIVSLAKLAFGDSHASYRFRRPLTEKVHQIDGGFYDYRGNSYRVECRWREEKADYGAIVEFADKIDVVGVSGLFISITGFDDRAVDKAKELRMTKAVILVDGEEVDLVMAGGNDFGQLISIKREHLDLRANPYFRVRGKPGVTI